MENNNLTKAEAENVLDLIDIYFFQAIRDDPDVDNFAWVESIVSARYKLMKIAEGKKDDPT